MAIGMFKKRKCKKEFAYTSDLYPTENVKIGAAYWERWIITRLINIFMFRGLDEGIDVQEMALRVFREDCCGIIPANGKHYAVSVSLSGYDAYENPDTITWANPVLGGGTRKIGDRCAVWYCTSLSHDRSGYIPEMIKRYAQILADAQASQTIALVNSRQTNKGVADDSQTAAAVKSNFDAIRRGEFGVINKDSILDKYQVFPNAESTSHLSDYAYVIDNVMRALWSELGIEYIQQKRTVTIDAEVGANGATLDCALVDMFVQAQKFVEQYNKVFNKRATVEINPVYLQREEDNADEQRND